MRLEGTLDAFSLPDIFQLLSYTKKTGALHLRRQGEAAEAHGVVHLRDGAVTSARSDVGRQALARRLVGAGLVDDDALEEAVSVVASGEGVGLAKVLSDLGAVDDNELRGAAVEHANDAVFELLRWPDGAFSFVVDEADPDDLGVTLAVDDIVAEGRRRLDHWPTLTATVPSTRAVVSVAPAPEAEPTLTRDEWALLSLIDGRRSVGDIVELSGRGEYAVVAALAALVERGLVSATEVAGADPLARRQALLGQLEGAPAPTLAPGPALAEVTAPQQAPPTPSQRPMHVAFVREEPMGDQPIGAAGPVVEEVAARLAGIPARPAAIPERPEPFTPTRQPDHAEEAPSYARALSPLGASPSAHLPTATAASVGAVHGSAAMQPAAAPETSSLIERDPSVNKSLLLRLIAGVRGL